MRKNRRVGRVTALGTLLVVVLVGIGVSVHLDTKQAEAREAYQAAQLRILAAAKAEAADDEFIRAAEQAAVQAKAEKVAAERAEFKTRLQAETEEINNLLAVTDKKVTDDETRVQLSNALESLTSRVENHDWTRAEEHLAELGPLKEALNASHAAWQAAEEARQAEEAKRAAEAAAKRQSQKSSSGGSGSIRSDLQAFLNTLPGSNGVSISWDDPNLDGHLGSAWMGCGNSSILINASKLDGQYAKGKHVVAHELAHVYQNRLMCSYGDSALRAELDAVFGSPGIERSADCVASKLTPGRGYYGASCSSERQVAWVNALIGGYIP